MMRFIHVAVAVLSLLSAGQAAPVTTCENLIPTIEINGTEQLLGKWIYIAESTNIPGSKLLTKMFVENAWTKITAANKSDVANIFHAQKMFGRCVTVTSQMTLENNTLTVALPSNVSEVLLKTRCPDCLVIYAKQTIGANTYTGLQFLSRREKVTAVELEDFIKQVECLNLPAPAILNPQKGLCPDESPSQETETTDLTNMMTSMGSEVLETFDRIVNSEDGVNTLIKVMTSTADRLKEN